MATERSRAGVWVGAATLVAVVLVHCADPSAPMTNHGTTFDVRSMLTANACGPQSVAVPSIEEFQAQLAVNPMGAAWRLVASGAMANGQYAPAVRAFRFTQDGYHQLRAADRVHGRAACVMRRYDVIDGTLSVDLSPPADGGDGEAGTAMDATADVASSSDASIADAGAPTFQATETILWGPVSGADCSDFVGASNGQFSQLPCTITYQMNGVATADVADGG